LVGAGGHLADRRRKLVGSVPQRLVLDTPSVHRLQQMAFGKRRNGACDFACAAAASVTVKHGADRDFSARKKCGEASAHCAKLGLASVAPVKP
jgi:hypothetical protein